MNLYLIRHAQAEDTTPDAQRRLSKRGKKQARILAAFLRRCGAFTPDEIWHSSLRRARETAELVKLDAKLRAALREVEHLAPSDDPGRIAREIAHCGQSVAVVGHEPHLSTLASLLVGGSADRVHFAMKKGAVLALENVEGHWLVRWHIAPEFLG